MSRLLAIDTATRHATVAVAVLGDPSSGQAPVVHGKTWHTEHNHGAELLPATAGLLAESGLGFGDLDAVAIVTGPGSFSALRVGVSTAQGIALANGLGLVPVSTFDVEWEACGPTGAPLCAVVGAGSAGVAWALRQDGLEVARGVGTPEACAGGCPELTVYCGEGASLMREVAPADRILSGGPPTRSAEALAAASFRLLARREPVDPSKIEITYARAPSITEPAKRLPDGTRAQRAR